MRTTLRLDDDLWLDLEREATRRKLTLGALELALEKRARGPKSKPLRQRIFSTGEPLSNLDKALTRAAAREDEATLEKLARHK
jgi:predicted DNA-binding ribbon-helix-helix protein